jgi:hypothetical protein
MNKNNDSDDKLRAIGIALKLFETCNPGGQAPLQAEEATEALIKTAERIERFIKTS